MYWTLGEKFKPQKDVIQLQQENFGPTDLLDKIKNSQNTFSFRRHHSENLIFFLIHKTCTIVRHDFTHAQLTTSLSNHRPD